VEPLALQIVVGTKQHLSDRSRGARWRMGHGRGRRERFRIRKWVCGFLGFSGEDDCNAIRDSSFRRVFCEDICLFLRMIYHIYLKKLYFISVVGQQLRRYSWEYGNLRGMRGSSITFSSNWNLTELPRVFPGFFLNTGGRMEAWCRGYLWSAYRDAGFGLWGSIKVRDLIVDTCKANFISRLPRCSQHFSKLATFLNLVNWREDMQSNILLSFYFNTWQWVFLILWLLGCDIYVTC
jgi:hypothetical protein